MRKDVVQHFGWYGGVFLGEGSFREKHDWFYF